MARFKDMFSFFSVRHQRMARLSEECPHLTPAIRNMVEGLLQIGEHEGIDLSKCQFRVVKAPHRRIVVSIITPQEQAASFKKQMDEKNRRRLEAIEAAQEVSDFYNKRAG